MRFDEDKKLFIGKSFYYKVSILHRIECYNEKGNVSDNVVEITKNMVGDELLDLITYLLKEYITCEFYCNRNIIRITNLEPITNLHNYYTITINHI